MLNRLNCTMKHVLGTLWKSFVPLMSPSDSNWIDQDLLDFWIPVIRIKKIICDWFMYVCVWVFLDGATGHNLRQRKEKKGGPARAHCWERIIVSDQFFVSLFLFWSLFTDQCPLRLALDVHALSLCIWIFIIHIYTHIHIYKKIYAYYQLEATGTPMGDLRVDS